MEAALADLSFMEWLILILLGLLFFKENLLTWIGVKLGITKESSNADSLSQQMSELAGYYNHDTTEKLDKLVSISENLVRGVEKIHTTHSEWEKYGVPARLVEKKITYGIQNSIGTQRRRIGLAYGARSR